MELQHIGERLKRILAEDLDLNLSVADIDDAVSFMDDGLALDSINLAEFIDRIESVFAIRIRDEDLGSHAFSSLATVVALVAARRGEPADGSAHDSADAPAAERATEAEAS